VPITSYQVSLDNADRTALTMLARRATAAHRQVLRARIVPAAADGATNAALRS